MRTRFTAAELWLRNQAAPVRTIQGFQFQTPNSGDVSTRVDPYANNMFMGSLKEKDADGVTRAAGFLYRLGAWRVIVFLATARLLVETAPRGAA